MTIKTIGVKRPVFVDDGGNPLPTGIGMNLFRAETGFTAKELARATGVSVRTVNGWYAGRRPTGWAMQQMAHILEAHRLLSNK